MTRKMVVDRIAGDSIQTSGAQLPGLGTVNHAQKDTLQRRCGGGLRWLNG